MHGWNGWGDPNISLPLPPEAKIYLEEHLGRLRSYPDATLEQVFAQVRASRLPAHP